VDYLHTTIITEKNNEKEVKATVIISVTLWLLILPMLCW